MKKNWGAIKITLFKWLRDFVAKYSFITKTDFKSGIFYLYYEKDGQTFYKKLPYRANKEQFVSVIEKIKHDINYYEKRAIRIQEIKDGKRDKPMIFANK